MSDACPSISVEIDWHKQIFRLSAPVFSGDSSASRAVAQFFASLQSECSRSFSLQEDKQILLQEEIPFSWGPQPTMREQVYRFLSHVKRCHHYLNSIHRMVQFSDAAQLWREER